jgi:hypothetical protein
VICKDDQLHSLTCSDRTYLRLHLNRKLHRRDQLIRIEPSSLPRFIRQPMHTPLPRLVLSPPHKPLRAFRRKEDQTIE